MSPGLINSSKPAASNTVSIFATRPVCGDSERAFMYHTFDAIPIPLSVPGPFGRGAADSEPLHCVERHGVRCLEACHLCCVPCYRKAVALSNVHCWRAGEDSCAIRPPTMVMRTGRSLS